MKGSTTRSCCVTPLVGVYIQGTEENNQEQNGYTVMKWIVVADDASAVVIVNHRRNSIGLSKLLTDRAE